MLPFLRKLFPALCLAAIPGTAFSQNAAPEPLPVAVVQKKTEEWITTRRVISEEAAAWQAEKSSLANLNEIRSKESAQLDEFVQAAGARVGELAAKKAALATEESDLKAWRAKLEADLVRLETGLRPLIPRLPPTLREKVEESIIRLEEAEPDQPLQNRARDVLLILQACLEFDNSLTVAHEVRELGGVKREIEVLYLGFSQAWYVDASNRFSGSGVPGDEGWIWTEDASLAPQVRSAVEIQTRRSTPAYVELPLRNVAGGKEGTP